MTALWWMMSGTFPLWSSTRKSSRGSIRSRWSSGRRLAGRIPTSCIYIRSPWSSPSTTARREESYCMKTTSWGTPRIASSSSSRSRRSWMGRQHLAKVPSSCCRSSLEACCRCISIKHNSIVVFRGEATSAKSRRKTPRIAHMKNDEDGPEKTDDRGRQITHKSF